MVGDEIQSVAIQLKAVEQYFAVALFAFQCGASGFRLQLMFSIVNRAKSFFLQQAARCVGLWPTLARNNLWYPGYSVVKLNFKYFTVLSGQKLL